MMIVNTRSLFLLARRRSLRCCCRRPPPASLSCIVAVSELSKQQQQQQGQQQTRRNQSTTSLSLSSLSSSSSSLSSSSGKILRRRQQGWKRYSYYEHNNYHHTVVCWSSSSSSSSSSMNPPINNNNNKISILSSSSSLLNNNNNSNKKNKKNKKSTYSSSLPFSSLSLYMWGEDTKGSLLLKQKQPEEEEKADVSSVVSSSTSSTSKTLTYNVPTLVDTNFILDHNNNHSSSSRNDTTTIRNIICGAGNETAIITNDNRCYVMGENLYGQLGVGHKKPVIHNGNDSTPSIIQIPNWEKQQQKQQELAVVGASTSGITEHAVEEEDDFVGIRHIELGSKFSAFIDTKGDLYTTGYGGTPFTSDGIGALGLGSEIISCTSPQLVSSLIEDDCSVQKVAISDTNLIVLTTNGELLSCGTASYGRLGNFDTSIDQFYLEPVEILNSSSASSSSSAAENNNNNTILDIVCGKSFTLALHKDGVIYGWGRNDKGQLGTGYGLAVDMYAMSVIPEPIGETNDLQYQHVIKIAAGSTHAACITKSGEVYMWGMSLYLEPVRVDSLSHTTIVDIQCGTDYTIALDIDGNIYSWGTNTPTLGHGPKHKTLHQPTLMNIFQDHYNNTTTTTGEKEKEGKMKKKKKVVQISAGAKHAACLVQEEEE